MQSAKCLLCGSDPVSFRWFALLLNGSSLTEIDLSRYCLRCGNIRMKTLNEIHRENPSKLFFYLLPEEKIE